MILEEEKKEEEKEGEIEETKYKQHTIDKDSGVQKWIMRQTLK